MSELLLIREGSIIHDPTESALSFGVSAFSKILIENQMNTPATTEIFLAGNEVVVLLENLIHEYLHSDLDTALSKKDNLLLHLDPNVLVEKSDLLGAVLGRNVYKFPSLTPYGLVCLSLFKARDGKYDVVYQCGVDFTPSNICK